MRRKEIIPTPKTKFVRVRCPECSQESIIFNAAKSEVKCKHCDEVIATTTGGLANITAEIIEIIE